MKCQREEKFTLSAVEGIRGGVTKLMGILETAPHTFPSAELASLISKLPADEDRPALPLRRNGASEPSLWVRVFPKLFEITPEIAEQAITNCAEVASKYDITMPDYLMVGTDTIGRTIVIASHIPNCQDIIPSQHRNEMRRIGIFWQDYLENHYWQKACIADLHAERNFGIDSFGKLKIRDIGQIYPADRVVRP